MWRLARVLAVPCLLSAAMLALAGCGLPDALSGSGPPPLPGAGPADAAIASPPSRGGGPVALAPRGGARGSAPPEIVLGTGRFAELPAAPAETAPGANGAEVTLDFNNVDVRDVARSVLGGLLRLTYVIDPAVSGTVTLQTGRPVPRAAVLDLLTAALQVSGVGLVARDGLYRVVPLAGAAREAGAGGGAGGFITRTVALQYVGAGELARALEGVVPSGVTIRPDGDRNLLVVSGSAAEVAAVLGHVAAFDVDFLRGVSFALLPLKNGRAKEVADAVGTVLATSGKAIADVVRISPITRMNAVLVTSTQPAYIERVRGWVERFDRADRNSDFGLYVYRVQNGRAADLAAVLRRALGIGGSDAPGTAGQQGGGETAEAQLSLSRAQQAGTAAALQNPLGAVGTAAAVGAGNALAGGAGGGAALGASGTAAQAGNSDFGVTADVNNNALVITASAQDYQRILAVLRQLDIPPLQVLIEATVAEVTLTDKLQFGLQYAIKSGGFDGIFAPNVKPTENTVPPNTIGSTFPGFSFVPGANFAFTAAGGSQVVLQALSRLTRVRVLSSPNLMVLNNRSAKLQVGEQVPIATQSAASTLTSNPLVLNSIDYRDTGIILNITPRVNESGLVLLDIAEEVSTVAPTTSSTLNTPTISQRRVTSSVAIQDGQTVGLGGLIKDSRSSGNSGIPWLKDIPAVGALFSTRDNSFERTELIVLITPRVLRGREDAEAAMAELRARLPMTVPVLNRRRR